MFPITINIAILVAIFAIIKYSKSEQKANILDANGNPQSIFNFTVDGADDEKPVSLSKYSGKKAYLVVNVASQCGLTDKNYLELQEIYDKYR